MTIGNNATISFKSHLCKYKTAPYQQWSRAFKAFSNTYDMDFVVDKYFRIPKLHMSIT